MEEENVESTSTTSPFLSSTVIRYVSQGERQGLPDGMQCLVLAVRS